MLAVGLVSKQAPASGCTALVLSSGLTHTVDEITEVPGQDESESGIKPNIWTSLAPHGAEGSLCSQQAACQPVSDPEIGSDNSAAFRENFLPSIKAPCSGKGAREHRRASEQWFSLALQSKGLVRVPCAGWEGVGRGRGWLIFESP